MFIGSLPVFFEKLRKMLALNLNGFTRSFSLYSALRSQTDWLENAIILEPYISCNDCPTTLIGRICCEINKIKRFKSHDNAIDTLFTIISNLWEASLIGKPVRYPRNKNEYVQGQRYRFPFFTYHTIVPMIDALETIGYISQKKGFMDKKKRRQTRMWATPALISLFMEHYLCAPGFIHKPEPKELIVLK